MKKYFTLTTIAVFATTILIGCKKDNNSNAVAKTKTQLLTDGTWSLTALVSDRDANGTYETNDYAAYSACYKDNFHTFRSNGDLEVNEGPTKCNPADPQTVIKHWQLTNNENTLVVDGDNDLIELNSTTLKIKLNVAGGMSFLSTFTKR